MHRMSTVQCISQNSGGKTSNFQLLARKNWRMLCRFYSIGQEKTVANHIPHSFNG